MILMNLFTRQQWRSTENRLLDTGRREERVKCMERVTWKLTLTMCKIDSQWEFAGCLRELVCINLEGWEAGERFKKEGGICTPMADSC